MDRCRYLGEVGTKGREWPQRAIGCGLLDLAGFEKPSFHMMKSLWTDAPFIAIYSQTANKSSYVEKDGSLLIRILKSLGLNDFGFGRM